VAAALEAVFLIEGRCEILLDSVRTVRIGGWAIRNTTVGQRMVELLAELPRRLPIPFVTVESLRPESYGEAFADVYDDWYGDISDVDATVATLVTMGGAGPFFELGIGTGRIALPLAATGAEVHGIDASPAMLRALAAKPGSEALRVICADMADLSVDGEFRVVFAAFNTFFNLSSEAAQRRCINRVAEILAADGHFGIEAFIPSREPDTVDHGEANRSDGQGGTITTTTSRDPVHQTVRGEHVHRSRSGTVTHRPWVIRYAHPHQLDAMCLREGLELADRWADWAGTPFDPSGERHVSLYRHAG
jgi:SAM-dependent methyltransferase